MNNDIYINILKSLVMLTNEANCWLIGSSSLVLLAQNYNHNSYKKFQNDTELFKTRDLDFIVIHDHDILDQLQQIGTITISKVIASQYKSLMFQTRNIHCIGSYKLRLGRSDTLSGSIIKNLIGDRNIEFNIDIIRVCTKTVRKAINTWPVSETKRNFAVYQYNHQLIHTEISDVSHHRDLRALTICNMIETLKAKYHLYGSAIHPYTVTGDKVNRIQYSFKNKLLEDDSITGSQQRLYDVLNGNSIELNQYIDIPFYD